MKNEKRLSHFFNIEVFLGTLLFTNNVIAKINQLLSQKEEKQLNLKNHMTSSMNNFLSTNHLQIDEDNIAGAVHSKSKHE